jgi:hypothetical protein
MSRLMSFSRIWAELLRGGMQLGYLWYTVFYVKDVYVCGYAMICWMVY